MRCTRPSFFWALLILLLSFDGDSWNPGSTVPPSGFRGLQAGDGSIRFEPAPKADGGFVAQTPEGYFLFQPNRLSFSAADPRLATRPLNSVPLLNWNGVRPSPGRGRRQLAGISHYYLGRESNRWRQAVPGYAEILFPEVYPGIDLLYRGRNHQVEIDFLVQPGANLDLIRFDSPSGEGLLLNPDGGIVGEFPQGRLLVQAPQAFSLIEGEWRPLPSAFGLNLDRQAGLRVDGWDGSRPLWLDPVISFSTYLGGQRINDPRKPPRLADDASNGVSLDPDGNIIVAGYTNSTDFPLMDPFQDGYASLACSTSGGSPCPDVFVSKFSPDGRNLIFSTYLGGGGLDFGYGVATDADGNVFVTGSTGSDDFPVLNAFQGESAGGFDDAFLAKFGPDGSLQFSTYLGTSGTEWALAIAVDSSGSPYLTGFIDADGLPDTGGFQPNYSGFPLCLRGTPRVRSCTDAFVVKFAPDGSSVSYASYLGAAGADQRGMAIAVDGSGNALIAGWTEAPNFPTQDPFQADPGGGRDAFLARFSPNGDALLFSTYLGGEGLEAALAVSTSPAGDSFVAGMTASTDFPMVGAFQDQPGGGQDGFVSRFSADGSELLFSSYLGGSSDDQVSALDQGGDQLNAAGKTASADFPTTRDAFQPESGDCALQFLDSQPGAWDCPLLQGLPSFNVNGLAFDPSNPSILYAGIGPLSGQATGAGLYRSNDGGETWQPGGNLSSTFTVSSVAVDFSNTQRVFAGVRLGGIFRSVDGGQQFEHIVSLDASSGLAFDPSDSNVIYSCGRAFDGVSKSVDGGDNWQGRIHGSFCFSILIDPTDTAHLYHGSSNGSISESMDGGDNWSNHRIPGSGGNVVALAFDPSDVSRIYAGQRLNQGEGGVFVSTDGGIFWNDRNNGLESLDVVALVTDPSNSSRIFAATADAGVFQSDDQGTNWRPLRAGMKNREVLTLVRNPSNGHLLAGSSAGGSDAFWTLLGTGEEGTELIYSSFLGGSGADAANGVARAADDSVLIAGLTSSRDFPVVDAFQASRSADKDSFLTRISPSTSLYLPLFDTSSDIFTGFAVSNFSDRRASLSFLSYDSTGGLTSADVNPARAALQPNTQLAMLGPQIFSLDAGVEGHHWVEIRTDNPEIGAFFQFGAPNLSRLDGSVALLEPALDLYLTRVFEGPEALQGQSATTRVWIVNPSYEPVTVEVELVSADPNPAGQTPASLDLPAKGFFLGTVSELTGDASIGQGYLKLHVTDGSGVIAFERIELDEPATLIGLNATPSTTSLESYSAQLAEVPGTIFTHVNLINTDSSQRNVTLRAVAEDGSNLVPEVQISLNPGEQRSQPASVLLGLGQGKRGTMPLVGTLRVSADGPGVVGDVIFGDPVEVGFAAALALQTATFKRAVFNHVANIPGFFTGLAFFNPSLLAALLEIEVVNSAGAQVGAAQIMLGPGERMSKLVPELVPSSEGQAGGSVRIVSDQAIIAQLLFGATSNGVIQLLSAVPPTVIE